MTRHALRAGTLAAALLATPALAEDSNPELQPAPGFGASGLTVHSGLTSYTGPLGGETDVGAFMDIQWETPLLPALGLEAGYEGSANGFAQSNVGALWRHNLGAVAKLGPTLGGHWKPFVGAGLGISYIYTNGAPDERNGFVPEFPLAAGVEYRFNGVTAGARASYRIIGGEAFTSGPSYEGDLLTAGLSLGARF
ncbi:outer membrane protein [Pyxidicoccus caerfyrddinensis]|uniref:outer membrane protein n=1 Tax=Pyxidicoccus caerfyrddinensis TaxID=2709663 RepID=UPI001F07C154|nr:outer membrane beta-barrel protein [Pyxidicoccus caerfyrddinensis]